MHAYSSFSMFALIVWLGSGLVAPSLVASSLHVQLGTEAVQERPESPARDPDCTSEL
jgi:hypothetical protein